MNKTEQISRMLEVLNILGGKLPENYELKEGKTILSNNPNSSQENYMEFDDENKVVTITLANNGHHYYWVSRLLEEGDANEKLSIDYGKLIACFYQTSEATGTSCFYLYNHSWGSPKIHSNINSTCIGCGENKQTYSIDDYYDVFVSYMRSQKENLSFIANKPEIIDIIIKMYESPIQKHISELKNSDQSWRFSVENSRIMDNYRESVNENYQIFIDAIEKANKQLNEAIELSKRTKDSELKELQELKGNYKHRVRQL